MTQHSLGKLDLRDRLKLRGGTGVLQNGRWGHVKFYPYEKGGGGILLAMLKVGHNKFWGSSYAVPQIFSHIEGGGGQQVSTL